MRNERGISLLSVLVVMILVGGIAFAFFDLSMNEARALDQVRNRMKATYLAEAGIEEAMFRIRQAMAGQQAIPTGGSITIAGTPVTFTIVDLVPGWTETDPTGLQTLYRQFEIVAHTRYNKALGRVTRVVVVGALPVFQFLAFYENDLEIQPGPAAIFHGRIHTNQRLYVGAGESMKLETEYVQAAETMHRRRKDDGSIMTGWVEIGSVPWDSMLESSSPDWPVRARALWEGKVKDGSMGARRMDIPSAASLDINGYYHQCAELIVIDDQAYYGGTNITTFLEPGTLQTQSIYDAREQIHVPVTRVNMRLLNSSAYFPRNGLLYAAQISHPRGIMIDEGSELSGPLTIVSPNPVYVRGDYNTLNKKPAAVISDAVNLLSNGWTGLKSPASGLPEAADTTYNTAILSGNLDTTSGAYNGGFENLPRFHENWTGRACKIRGSFVNLWRSRLATGAWVYGEGRYTAPNRDWDFDSDFNDPRKLPPFSPMAVSVIRTTYKEGY